VAKLYVDKERMKSNMELSNGALFSSQILLLLVTKGLSREDAYKVVQEMSHALKKGESLRTKILTHGEVKKRVKKSEIENLFKDSSHKKRLSQILDRVGLK
jgi:adenylosuccinate lyase